MVTVFSRSLSDSSDPGCCGLGLCPIVGFLSYKLVMTSGNGPGPQIVSQKYFNSVF